MWYHREIQGKREVGCIRSTTSSGKCGIQQLHRESDGYVTFHRIDRDDGDRFHNLAAIRASDLDRVFPEFIEYLSRDSFFSVNAFKFPSNYRSTIHPGLKKPRRTCDNLRWLTSCFVDLDVYKNGKTFSEVFAQIIEMQESGDIPPATWIVNSGRGLWLLWMLHDKKNPNQPQSAFFEKRMIWNKIQSAIFQRLAKLGADANSKDGSRVTRIPGSMNTKAERRVSYWTQHDDQGQRFSYTMDQLAEAFNVKTSKGQKQALALVTQLDEEQRQKKKRGWIALQNKRMKMFTALWTYRDGFREGCRNNAALIYAWLLFKSGRERQEVLSAVTGMAKDCKPQLKPHAVRGAVNQARKYSKFKDQTISDWLEITTAESEMLADILDSTTCKPLPPATRFQDAPWDEPPKMTRPEMTKHRRSAIQGMCAGKTGNDIPTLTELRESLANIGIEACARTIGSDMKALEIKTPRQHRTATEKDELLICNNVHI